MSYLEERLYSEAFEDGMNYAIEKMYAFTEFNKRAFNKKLELAKKGKLVDVPGNYTNTYMNNMAKAIKDGDKESFNFYLKNFKDYQTTTPEELEHFKKALTDSTYGGGRNTANSFDARLYKRKQDLEEFRKANKDKVELNKFRFP